jgi:hypothetical protein
MRRPPPWLVAVSLGLACSSQPAGQSIPIAPSIVFPRGVIDQAQRLEVTVYDAVNGVDCDASGDGAVSGDVSTVPSVGPKDLVPTDCPALVKFCGNITITQSETPRAFYAQALDAKADLIAQGCTQQVVDSDTVQISILMKRVVPPSTCNNQTVPGPVQCSTGSATDTVCDPNCISREIYVSVPSSATGTQTGAPGDKQRPAFVWPALSGNAGTFFAMWGDKTPTNSQVAVRVLGDSLEPSTLLPGVGASSFFIPDGSNNNAFPPAPEPHAQFDPAGALAGQEYYVVFEDNPAGPLDIDMRSIQAATLVSDQPQGQPIPVNGNAGQSGSRYRPSISAGPNGFVFVAWEDGPVGQPGVIKGRVYDTTGKQLGTEQVINTDTTSRNVSVAGTPTGWVAAWESGNFVKMRLFDSSGNPAGAEQNVSSGAQAVPLHEPSVAAVADGAFAIVWADRGPDGSLDIFVQRYASDRTPVANDSSTAINNVVTAGDQTSPAISATSVAGGAYAVAWTDTASGHVRARLLGEAGDFLFNSVNGQEDEFQASLTNGRVRAHPAVAIGGAGPYVAIGWEDNTLSGANPGIYARRFPAPSQ